MKRPVLIEREAPAGIDPVTAPPVPDLAPGDPTDFFINPELGVTEENLAMTRTRRPSRARTLTRTLLAPSLALDVVTDERAKAIPAAVARGHPGEHRLNDVGRHRA